MKERRPGARTLTRVARHDRIARRHKTIKQPTSQAISRTLIWTAIRRNGVLAHTMDLNDFARFLLRRAWIAVLLAVLGAAAGLAYARIQTPVYKAVTRLAVAPARPGDLGQTQATKEIMRSFIKDIYTFEMADATAFQLGEEWLTERGLEAASLYYMLRVGSDENVYEIQVEARSPEPDTAVQISEKWAIAFEDRRATANRQLDLRDQITVRRRDTTTPEIHSPRRRMLAGVGGVAGLALGVLLMLSLEYLSRAVVRNAGDAESIGGAAVLGVIPPNKRGHDKTSRRQSALLIGGRDLAGATLRGIRAAWPAALLALIGAASGYLVSRAQPVVHQARTRIAIEPARASDWGQTQAIPEIMRSFTEDIATRLMAQEVNARLELDLPPERLLADKLTVAPRESDYEIHLDIRDQDEETAKAISREWAQVFIENRSRQNNLLDQRDRILVRQRDITMPLPQYSPRTMANTLAGLVIGLLIGAGVALLLMLVRAQIIQTPAQAERAANAPPLGTIPPTR